MDKMPSTEFRLRYASLTQPTIVTVNGHPIGTYQPISAAIDTRAVDAIRPGEPRTPGDLASHLADNFAQFRPVPKPSQRHG